MNRYLTMCSHGFGKGGHRKKSRGDYPWIIRWIHGCGSVTKRCIRACIRPLLRIESYGNTYPGVTQNGANVGDGAVHSNKIMWRVSLSHRPEEVTTRTPFGHWESDSIIGASNGGGIHTSLERKSRFLCAVKIPAITAVDTFETQHRMFEGLPAHAVASVTADNGFEFAHHYKLADTLGIPTYFCDPYSSWQRCTNEHFNGRIRRYLPKKTRFDDLTQEELDQLVAEINNRPRIVLGWFTPAILFQVLSLAGSTSWCVAL